MLSSPGIRSHSMGSNHHHQLSQTSIGAKGGLSVLLGPSLSSHSPSPSCRPLAYRESCCCISPRTSLRPSLTHQRASPPPQLTPPGPALPHASTTSFQPRRHQHHPAHASPPRPSPLRATWDQQLDSALHACDENSPPDKECDPEKKQSLISRLLGYASRTLTGQHKNRPLLSDLCWTFTCCFLGVLALGALASISISFPGVLGHWHRQGLPILLGSFGTLCVLIFARPESEPIKIWNLIVGEVLSVIVAVAVLRILGLISTPLIVSRALAMSLAIVAMMWTDSVHPPGGALVLVASDSPAAASMGLWLAFYPGLVLTMLILLPLGLICNHLKKSHRFDYIEKQSDSGISRSNLGVPGPQTG